MPATPDSTAIEALLLQSRELAYRAPHEAYRLAVTAASQAERINEPQLQIRCNIHAMSLLFDRGELHEGGEWLMKALTVAETHDLHPEHGYLLAQLGILHYTLGENIQALEYWTDCLDYSNERFSNDARIYAHIGTGQIYYAYGQFDAALRHHLHAKSLAEAGTTTDLLTSTLINLAADYNQLERYDEMRAALDEAEALSRRAGNLNYLGEVCYYMTLLALVQNDPARARQYADEAASMPNICIWSEVSNVISHAQILRRDGQFDEAFALMLQAIDRAEKAHCSHHLFLVYRQIAAMYHENGNFAESARYHRRYQECFQRMVNPEVLDTLATLEEKLLGHD
ncbi:tetratricopeptide repeat protein [Chitinilyticum aquatile]|uniref:tetratricopeptide repeat protein n=1 Tax=Chitinilyticum aquatile TaxID=362520 RepID=UPI000418D98B|nr:tetratricopeptide repeat protein [Chitinilyticum aquatile]